MIKRAVFARELGVPIIMHDYLTGDSLVLVLESEAYCQILARARGSEFLPGFYLEVSPEREKARLGESGSPGGVEYWAILKDSCLSEIWLAWERKSC
ncbi:hypothetical protein Lal_00031560 [Lupinus albus]|nr:hypothetical protein Lal_00031560 [Lupinus albus]